jgi:predicted  nucleic acid-binding Zn-ribbon protein
VKADLAQLIQLQALDLQIRDLARQRDELPIQVEFLQKQIADVQQTVQTSQSTLDELRKRRRGLEADVDVVRVKLSRYKEQLMAVKTNKEYTAMLNEIDQCSKEISAKEDEVIVVMEKIEAAEGAIAGAEVSLASQRKDVEKRQEELRKQSADLTAQVSLLETDRGKVLEGISQPSLSLYGRIAAARKGVALAEARDQSCQGCHVRLRPQMFNEIRKNEQLITCESCNRILYSPS